MNSNKSFSWDDNLVNEFISQIIAGPLWHEWNAMEKFKESKKPKKEWEILSLKRKDRNSVFLTTKEGIDSWLEGNEKYSWDIYSVKRLSDNEIFTVGDFIVPHQLEYSHPIIGFGFMKNDLYVNFTLDGSENEWNTIIGLRKSPPKPKPLFVDAIFEQYIDEPKFPCMFVPLIMNSNNGCDYNWTEADIVDCKIRGAGHYFKLYSAKQKIQGDK